MRLIDTQLRFENVRLLIDMQCSRLHSDAVLVIVMFDHDVTIAVMVDDIFAAIRC